MKTICKFFLVALCFWAFTNKAMGQGYSGGSGTENDPYLISSKADMEALANAVNNGNNYSQGKYFLLTQDITEVIVTVIGFYGCYFAGTFDGGGHSINTNISVSMSHYSDNYFVGVFGNIRGATIKNLKVNGRIYPILQPSVLQMLKNEVKMLKNEVIDKDFHR